MKKIFLFFIIFSIFLFFGGNVFAFTSVDIKESDIYNKEFKLNHEWDFYWNKLIDSSNLDFSKIDKKIKVPSLWTSYDKSYISEGCATYRIVLNMPYDGVYSIKIPFMSHSYNVISNGELVARDGNVSCSKEYGYESGKRSQIVSVSTLNKQIDLIVQIASFNDRFAGMQDYLSIGKQEVIYKNREISIALNFFIFSTIFVMALYNLIMFIIKRSDLSFLIFFFLCLVTIVRLVSADFMATWFFNDIDFNIILKSAFISMILLPLFVVLFFKYLFYSDTSIFKSKSIIFIIIFSFIILISVFIFPVNVLSKYLYFYQAFVLLISLFALYYLLNAVKQKREEALFLLLGTIIIFIFAINDILYTNSVINSTYLVPFGLVIFIFFQFFVLSKRYNKISELYNKDPLTDIFNKRYLIDFINSKINSSNIDNDLFSIAILDIDYFKSINDSYGHDFGDIVLKDVSKKIQESLRRYDLFSRYGGEEFVVVFDRLNSKDSFLISDRIRDVLSDFYINGIDKQNNNVSVKITISIGICEFNKNKHYNFNSIIKNADHALYEAKNSGRNKVVVFDFDN